jgi:branched-chain amino acid transport system substrate-binding protein
VQLLDAESGHELGEPMARGRLQVIAAAAAFTLVAVACGDDDDDGGGAADTDAPSTGSAPATTGAGASTSAPVTTGGPATTEGAATTDGAATTAGPGSSAPATGEPPSGEPIQIGVLTSLTGNFAPWGVQARDGMQLAVNEINAAGGADGRPLELVVADDQTDPDQGATEIERLIESGVVAVGGVISSDVALSTARTAEELETPLFLVKAGSEAILTDESRYTFRTCLPAAPMVAGPIAQYAEQEGLTRIGAIIADYAWGQAFRSAFENEFADVEGVETQVEVAPVPETDFTTYLRSLEGFEPDLIVATGHPPGSGPITVQSQDLGLDVPVTGAYSPWALVFEGAGDAAVGRYSDFDCADYQSEEYQELARRYLAMSDNTFMEDDAVAGYGIVTMVAEAVGEVGDDPAAIAEYLHAQTFDGLPGYAFDVSWTEWGELAAAQPLFSVLGEGPAPEGVNEAGDWYPETLILPDPLEPYEP